MNTPQYWADMLDRIGPEGVEGLIDEMVNLLDSPNDNDQKEVPEND